MSQGPSPSLRLATVLMLTPLALPAQDSSAEYNEPYQRKALEVYRTNVSSRSSEGHGQAPPGARYLADEFRAAGFPEQDIHVLPFTGADGGETAALYRAATRPAMSYDGAVVETPLGLLPLDMLHQMVRGPDLLAVVIIVQRLFARWAGRGKPERPAAASAITVALAYAAPSR